MLINGPARVTNPSNARAIRNPTYTGGVITGSSGTPGGPANLPIPTNPGLGQSGRTRALLQAILSDRSNPYKNQSLEEDELRRAALSRLRG